MKKDKPQVGAAERYSDFLGKHIIVYYRDMRGTDRKLHGILTSIKGDVLQLENGAWTGSLDCTNAKITLVSTIEGWGRGMETKDERRTLVSRLFR